MSESQSTINGIFVPNIVSYDAKGRTAWIHIVSATPQAL
jgi:hypothetical protein